MKTYLPLAVVALLCACQTPTPLTFQQQQAARMALAKRAKHHAAVDGVAEAPITMATRFAARCPYCDTVSFNTSCLPSGGTSMAEGKTLQTFSISYTCPGCLMPFSDSRRQVVEPVTSIRLPVGGQ